MTTYQRPPETTPMRYDFAALLTIARDIAIIVFVVVYVIETL